MAPMRHCLECSEKVAFDYKICPYCGFNYAKYMNTPIKEPKRKLFQKLFQPKPKKEKKPMFTNAEVLALGLYPKSESYKRSIMCQMYDEK